MLISLLGLCFKWRNTNLFVVLRKTNAYVAEIPSIASSQASQVTGLELHRSTSMLIRVLDLLLRKAAGLIVSEPPAYFKYVSIVLNHTVATAGLNSRRAISKSCK